MKYKFFLQSGRFNGLLQVWGENEIELTDTQEAQMQLDIETALDQHDALRRVAEAARGVLREKLGSNFDQKHWAEAWRDHPLVQKPLLALLDALAALDKIKEGE